MNTASPRTLEDAVADFQQAMLPCERPYSPAMQNIGIAVGAYARRAVPYGDRALIRKVDECAELVRIVLAYYPPGKAPVSTDAVTQNL